MRNEERNSENGTRWLTKTPKEKTKKTTKEKRTQKNKTPPQKPPPENQCNRLFSNAIDKGRGFLKGRSKRKIKKEKEKGK